MWDLSPSSPVIVLPPDMEMTTFEEGSTSFDPSLPPYIIPPLTLYSQLTDISSPYQIINIPLPTRIQYLLNQVPLGHLVEEVADPELIDEEFEELIAFIT